MRDFFFVYHFCFSFSQVDVEEVMYIVKELWHGRSAREKHVKDVGRGMWRSVNELMLVRYGVACDFIFRLPIFHFQTALYG